MSDVHGQVPVYCCAASMSEPEEAPFLDRMLVQKDVLDIRVPLVRHRYQPVSVKASTSLMFLLLPF